MNRGAQLLVLDVGERPWREYTTGLAEEIEKLAADGKIAGREVSGGLRHGTVWSWAKGFTKPRYFYRKALWLARGIPEDAWDQEAR